MARNTGGARKTFRAGTLEEQGTQEELGILTVVATDRSYTYFWTVSEYDVYLLCAEM
jgi:hypothetical protein